MNIWTARVLFPPAISAAAYSQPAAIKNSAICIDAANKNPNEAVEHDQESDGFADSRSKGRGVVLQRGNPFEE